MVRRRKGFTLIELLVVIAIIGILAAMVFPVFARARESARKAVCLSNVKNVGLAIQMYLADNNDTFWPEEHRQEVLAYFNTFPGGWTDGPFENDVAGGNDCPIGTYRANPYLRPTVILDEYVKNRDVWRCPSSKMTGGALVIVPGPDWFGYVVSNDGMFGHTDRPVCLKDSVFPPGWGGAVTDSFLQGPAAANAVTTGWGQSSAAQKSFLQSIALNGYGLIEVKMAAIQDPVSFVVAGDGGAHTEYLTPGTLAYADLCNVECGNCACSTSWGVEDPACQASMQAVCPEAVTCFQNYHTSSAMLRDQTLLKKGSRHLGGTNVAFADGHATWMQSGTWIDKWADQAKSNHGMTAFGLESFGPLSWCSSSTTSGDAFSVAFPDEPTLR